MAKTAEIPLFERFRVELEKTPKEGAFVWPVAARLYSKPPVNPHTVTIADLR